MPAPMSTASCTPRSPPPDGFHLFACDHIEGMGEYTPGTNVHVSLSGDENESLTSHWNGLSEGGQLVVPLEPQMWGDVHGQCVDKFGIIWHVDIAGETAGDGQA